MVKILVAYIGEYCNGLPLQNSNGLPLQTLRNGNPLQNSNGSPLQKTKKSKFPPFFRFWRDD